MNLTGKITGFLALVISIIALVLVLHAQPQLSPTKNDSAYERILSTQTLRCGYVIFTPNVLKNPNTNALYGVDVDIVEALAKKLDLKVDWVEEVSFGTAVAGLKAGRYDVLCSGDWIDPHQGKEAFFSRPNYFQPMFTVVRANDHRFDASLDKINDPNIKISALDNDDPMMVAHEDFPKADIFALTDQAAFGMVMESVATNKADVTFSDAASFGDYDAHNSGKLKLIHTTEPVRIYPVGYMLPMGDVRLKAMIDSALDELIYSGQIDKILARYEKYPNSFILIDRPKAKGIMQ